MLMVEKLKNINGCLGDGHTDDDWKITWEMLDELPELEIQDQKIFEYNQGSTPHCTIYSALWALSDLWNRELTQEQIDETVEESYNRGRKKGEWWYTKDAVNLACDMRMKWYPEEKVAYYRIPNWFDDDIHNVISKNYSLCTSFNWNTEYKIDRFDNWRIDNSHKWPFSYGHCVCLIEREWRKFVKDNYRWRKENWYFTNIYEIVPKISTLKYDGCWQNYSYVIVKIKDEKEEDIKRLNEMKNAIDKLIEDTDKVIKEHSAMRYLTNDKVYQDEMHDANVILRRMQERNAKKKEDIERELAKYFK